MQLTVAEPLGLFLSHRYKLANSELVFAQQGGGADLELAILIPHPCLQACTDRYYGTALELESSDSSQGRKIIFLTKKDH